MSARHPLVRFGPILGLLFLPSALGCVGQEAVIVNLPPDCTGATLQPDDLWPPDHEYVRVQILGVTDPEGDKVAIDVTGVPRNQGAGGACVDGGALFSSTICP